MLRLSSLLIVAGARPIALPAVVIGVVATIICALAAVASQWSPRFGVFVVVAIVCALVTVGAAIMALNLRKPD